LGFCAIFSISKNSSLVHYFSNPRFLPKSELFAAIFRNFPPICSFGLLAAERGFQKKKLRRTQIF